MSGKSAAIRNSRGVILTDLLLTILIVLMLVPAVMICLQAIQGTLSFSEEVQDMIAEAQIRHILLIADHKEIEGETLVFAYQNRQMRLSFVNDHLILQPGTQIFFSDTDQGMICARGNLIYAVYTRAEVTYEKVIGTLS